MAKGTSKKKKKEREREILSISDTCMRKDKIY